MKPVKIQMQKLRANGGIMVNGRRYVNYAAFMWYCRQSDHPHQLERKQQKYPAHFITVNEKPYVTEDYARYILINQQTLLLHQRLVAAAIKKGGAL